MTVATAQVGGSGTTAPKAAAKPTYASECQATARTPPCQHVEACRTAVETAIQKLRDEDAPVAAYYEAVTKVIDRVFAANSFSKNLALMDKELKEIDVEEGRFPAATESVTKFPSESLRKYIAALVALQGTLDFSNATGRSALKTAEESAEKFQAAAQTEIANGIAKRLREFAAKIEAAAGKFSGIDAYASDARAELTTAIRKNFADAKAATLNAQQTACSFGATLDDVTKGISPQTTTTTTAGADGNIIVDRAVYGHLPEVVKLEKLDDDLACEATAFLRRMCQYVEKKICMNPNTNQQQSVDKGANCPTIAATASTPEVKFIDVGADFSPAARAFCTAKVTRAAMCGERDPSPGEERQIAVFYRCSPSWSLEKKEYLEARARDGEYVYLDCINAQKPVTKAPTKAATR